MTKEQSDLTSNSTPHIVIEPGDWPEDFEHENGNYQNICVRCQSLFVGYKRRHVCKVCAKRTPTMEQKQQG